MRTTQIGVRLEGVIHGEHLEAQAGAGGKVGAVGSGSDCQSVAIDEFGAVVQVKAEGAGGELGGIIVALLLDVAVKSGDQFAFYRWQAEGIG